jgi:hypothetical protein
LCAFVVRLEIFAVERGRNDGGRMFLGFPVRRRRHAPGMI